MASETCVIAPTTSLFSTHEPDIHLDTEELETEFTYYKDPGDGKKPHQAFIDKPETFARPSETVTGTVYNIRGQEHQYSLDKTGFQVVQHTSQEKDFRDEQQIKKVYYPEIEEMLKKVYVVTPSQSTCTLPTTSLAPAPRESSSGT